MDLLWQVLLALLPSLGVGFLFYTIIKALVEGDRRERKAYSEWADAQERAREQSEQQARGSDEDAPSSTA
ncbi:MAG: lysyl-tRNA synthetase [Mobilicoccus sp.]|nr:lysyl-tRNA synthetase [Mobilicoccus sp.]